MSLLLLVAPSGQGKTTACLRPIELARANNLRVSGLLSLPVYQGQEKVAISLRDIAKGQERLLARKCPPGEKPEVGVWKFDTESLAWGQEVLASLPPSDLLAIDEIGPIEMIGIVEQVYPEFSASVALVDVRVYADENRPLLQREQIRYIPTLIFYDQRETREVAVGVMEAVALRQELEMLRGGQ